MAKRGDQARSHVPIIFWNVDELIRRTNHIVLLASLTEQCWEKKRVITRIIKQVAPLVELWMRRNDVSDLLLLYSEFLLLLKSRRDE
jgi:hypothetical protein